MILRETVVEIVFVEHVVLNLLNNVTIIGVVF